MWQDAFANGFPENLEKLQDFDLSDVGPCFSTDWDSKWDTWTGAAIARKMLLISNRGVDVVGAVPIGINDAIKKLPLNVPGTFETQIDFKSTSEFHFGCDFTEEEMDGCITFDHTQCSLAELPPKTKPDVPVSTSLEALEDVEEKIGAGLTGKALRDLSVLVGLLNRANQDPTNLLEHFSKSWGIAKEDVMDLVHPVSTAVSAGRMTALISKSTTQILGKENMGGTVVLTPTGVTKDAWSNHIEEDEEVAIDWGRYEVFLKAVGYSVYEMKGSTYTNILKLGKILSIQWSLHPQAAILYKRSDFTLPKLPIPETSSAALWKKPLQQMLAASCQTENLTHLLRTYGMAILEYERGEDMFMTVSLGDLKTVRAKLKSSLLAIQAKPEAKTVRQLVSDVALTDKLAEPLWHMPGDKLAALSLAGPWTSLCHLLFPEDRLRTVALAQAAFSSINTLLPTGQKWATWTPDIDLKHELIPLTMKTAYPDFVSKWIQILGTGKRVTAVNAMHMITSHCVSGLHSKEAKAISSLLNVDPRGYIARVRKVAALFREDRQTGIQVPGTSDKIAPIVSYQLKIEQLIARYQGALMVLEEMKSSAAEAKSVYYQLMLKYLTNSAAQTDGKSIKLVMKAETKLIRDWIHHYARKRNLHHNLEAEELTEMIAEADEKLTPKYSFKEVRDAVITSIDGLDKDFNDLATLDKDRWKAPVIEARSKEWYIKAPEIAVAEGEALDLTDLLGDLSLTLMPPEEEKVPADKALIRYLANLGLIEEDLPKFWERIFGDRESNASTSILLGVDKGCIENLWKCATSTEKESIGEYLVSKIRALLHKEAEKVDEEVPAVNMDDID